MATLNTLLVHPDITRVHGKVISSRPCTNHNHPTAFADKGRDGKSAFTGVFKHHVDIHAFSGDIPDCFAKFAHLGEPSFIFVTVHRGKLTPTIKVLPVDDPFCAKAFDKFALVLVRNHRNRIGPNRIDQLDGIRSQSAGCPPDQNVLPRLQFMRMMTKQHSIGCCQCQCVASAFFPCQVFRARHQLLSLNIGELRKRPVRCFITPNSLARRQHRIATVAFFIVSVILVAVDDNFIANFPAGHFLPDRPNDTGGIRTCDMKICLVNIKRADRNAKTGPNTIIIHSSRHHENEHLVAVQFRHINDL